MQKKYLELPISLEIREGAFEYLLVDEYQSICKNLFLILSTFKGESRFDPDFGTNIWDKDFHVVNDLQWMEEIEQSIFDAFTQYESRINFERVMISFKQTEDNSSNSISYRKQLSVQAYGTYIMTGESFQFKQAIYLSPITSSE
jgi:phage baseplate assembly protein W